MIITQSNAIPLQLKVFKVPLHYRSLYSCPLASQYSKKNPKHSCLTGLPTDR